MVHYLLTELEAIVRKEPFVLLDTSAINSHHGPRRKSSTELICEKTDLSQIPDGFFENVDTQYQTLLRILQQAPFGITKEIFAEFHRGITAMTKIIQLRKEERFDSGEFDLVGPKRKYDSRRLHLRDIAGDVQDTFKDLDKHVQQYILSFQQRHAYKLLFSFFKYLAPFVKHTQKTVQDQTPNPRYPYLFGDESLSAALFYYVLTQGHDKPSVAVVAEDHDIKREIRAAYHLFNTINPELFTESIQRTPFRVYVLSSRGKDPQPHYHLLLNSPHPRSFGSGEKERLFLGDKNDEILETSWDVFNKVC